MPELIHVDIITPEKIILQAKALAVEVPASEGTMQVLHNHEPYVALLEQGNVVLFLEDGKEKNILIGEGILEVEGKSCKIMVDIAIDKDNYNKSLIASSIDKLNKELLEEQDEKVKELLTQRLRFYDLLAGAKNK